MPGGITRRWSGPRRRYTLAVYSDGILYLHLRPSVARAAPRPLNGITVSVEHVELEQAAAQFKPVIDRRRHMPEPPPVWLVAVEDVHAPAAAGLETQLDEFYVGLLRFERQQAMTDQIIYKAENLRLCIDVVEPPVHRLDFRPIGIEVPSVAAVEQHLAQRQIEYEWQKGLTSGSQTLLLRDPAGNWVQIEERQRIL